MILNNNSNLEFRKKTKTAKNVFFYFIVRLINCNFQGVNVQKASKLSSKKRFSVREYWLSYFVIQNIGRKKFYTLGFIDQIYLFQWIHHLIYLWLLRSSGKRARSFAQLKIKSEARCIIMLRFLNGSKIEIPQLVK